MANVVPGDKPARTRASSGARRPSRDAPGRPRLSGAIHSSRRASPLKAAIESAMPPALNHRRLRTLAASPTTTRMKALHADMPQA